MILAAIDWAAVAEYAAPILGAIAVVYGAYNTAAANRVRAEAERKLADVNAHKTEQDGWGLLTEKQQASITQLYTRIEALQDRLQTAEVRADELNDSLRAAREELVKLRAQLADIQVENEKRITDLETQLKTSKFDNKRLGTQVFDLKRENDALRKRVAELERRNGEEGGA